MEKLIALFIFVFAGACKFDSRKQQLSPSDDGGILFEDASQGVVSIVIPDGGNRGLNVCITDKDYSHYGATYTEITTDLGFKVALPSWLPAWRHKEVGQIIDKYWRDYANCYNPNFRRVTVPLIKNLRIVVPARVGFEREGTNLGLVYMRGFYWRSLLRSDRTQDIHCIKVYWRETVLVNSGIPMTQDIFGDRLTHEMMHWYYHLLQDRTYDDHERFDKDKKKSACEKMARKNSPAIRGLLPIDGGTPR